MADRDRSTPYRRYRVEEREGRLVVIDAGQPNRTRPARPGQAIVPRLYRGTIAICKNNRGAAGQLIFTTDKRDKKGPRRFVLDDDGIRRVALGTIASAAVAIALLAMVFVDFRTGVSLSVFLGIGVTYGGKSAYTRWADGISNPIIDD